MQHMAMNCSQTSRQESVVLSLYVSVHDEIHKRYFCHCPVDVGSVLWEDTMKVVVMGVRREVEIQVGYTKVKHFYCQ